MAEDTLILFSIDPFMVCNEAGGGGGGGAKDDGATFPPAGGGGPSVVTVYSKCMKVNITLICFSNQGI